MNMTKFFPRKDAKPVTFKPGQVVKFEGDPYIVVGVEGREVFIFNLSEKNPRHYSVNADSLTKSGLFTGFFS